MLVYQGLKTPELGKLEVNDINLREGKINASRQHQKQQQGNDIRSAPDP